MEINNLFDNYKNSVITDLNNINKEQLRSFIAEIDNMAMKGSKLFILGNGGSAATASHFVNDILALNIKFNDFRLESESLSENSSVVTAIANDLSFEDVFVEQLKVKMKKDDALLIISASGNSPNLVKAAQWAHSKEYTIFSLTGFDGGEVKKLSDYPISSQTNFGEYERVEDLHLIINHFIRYYFQAKFN